jgi:ketosteroid isomerase-like protein
MMAPGGMTVHGLESAAESMQKAFDAFEFRVEYRSEESAVAGDWGFDRGRGIGTLTPKAGGAPITENSKYLWIYGRASDGSWKLTHVIWNSNGSVSGAQ